MPARTCKCLQLHLCLRQLSHSAGLKGDFAILLLWWLLAFCVNSRLGCFFFRSCVTMFVITEYTDSAPEGYKDSISSYKQEKKFNKNKLVGLHKGQKTSHFHFSREENLLGSIWINSFHCNNVINSYWRVEQFMELFLSSFVNCKKNTPFDSAKVTWS